MQNFNMLRLIVYEIFDNSQLFLTDPRLKYGGVTKFTGTSYNIDKGWSDAPDGRFRK